MYKQVLFHTIIM